MWYSYDIFAYLLITVIGLEIDSSKRERAYIQYYQGSHCADDVKVQQNSILFVRNLASEYPKHPHVIPCGHLRGFRRFLFYIFSTVMLVEMPSFSKKNSLSPSTNSRCAPVNEVIQLSYSFVW